MGGVVLGALIGVGALLILPKVFHAFSGAGAGGYGAGNYRSTLLFNKILHFLLNPNSLWIGVDDTGITDMLNRVDDYLAQNNIDSTSCLGKSICHYVRSSEYHMTVGTADQVEQMISALSQ